VQETEEQVVHHVLRNGHLWPTRDGEWSG
jgi:hypothetical protein